MRGEAKNGKLMAITWLARTAEQASAGMALSRTYSPLRRPPARSFARCSMPDENGRRSMKEARLLSERASERVLHFRKGEKIFLWRVHRTMAQPKPSWDGDGGRGGEDGNDEEACSS